MTLIFTALLIQAWPVRQSVIPVARDYLLSGQSDFYVPAGS